MMDFKAFHETVTARHDELGLDSKEPWGYFLMCWHCRLETYQQIRSLEVAADFEKMSECEWDDSIYLILAVKFGKDVQFYSQPVDYKF